MASFRFETYENVVTKHTLPKVHWSQAALWAFKAHSTKRNWTIASVKQLDSNTVEIVKRRDVNKNICYKTGFDQHNVYERVVINRADKSVAVDRLDINWLNDKPFLGQRDLFYPSSRGGDHAVDFVRHNFWIHKLTKTCEQMGSHFSAWSYRYAFHNTEAVTRHE